MSETKTFNIADPLQIRDALAYSNQRIGHNVDALNMINETLMVAAYAIAQGADRAPVVKADLVARLSALASTRPQNRVLQDVLLILRGQGIPVPPVPSPGAPPPAAVHSDES